MNLANGSPDDNGDHLSQRTNGIKGNSFQKNGKNSQQTHENSHNGNGLNNNRDEYKMDMKTSDKVTEDDPLTGHQKWEVVKGSPETSKPRWTHKLSSTKFFMVIFLLAYVLQGISLEDPTNSRS